MKAGHSKPVKAADNRTIFQVPNLNPALTETFTYSFDDADNITGISKAVGAGSPVPIMSFSSDDDGNLLTKTDLASSVVTELKWTDYNRLASIETKLAGVPTGDIKQSNTFGVSGFRRKKKDKNDIETTEYAAGLATAVSKATSGETITYLMGHRIMGFERSSDGAMFYLICDALSTARDIVNSSGSVVASYEFAEYGQRIATSESGVSSQKTFVGGRSVQDEVADTGLMMMGHRFYDPSGPGGGTGRFLNRDPIGFRGGLNLFEYAGSRPTQATDARGLQWSPADDEESERIFQMVADGDLTFGQGEAEFLLGFNPFIGTGLSIRDFVNEPGVVTTGVVILSLIGLRSVATTSRLASGGGRFLRRSGQRGTFNLGNCGDDIATDIANVQNGFFIRNSSKLKTTRIYAGFGSKPPLDIEEGVLNIFERLHPDALRDRWRKVFGTVDIEDFAGNIEEAGAEIHWYDNPEVGKIWKKMKGFTDKR